MFEKDLAAKLKRIFDLDKVTFDLPGASHEQEGLFVEVESARMNIREGTQSASVDGKIHVFAENNKMPFGYFNKQLAAASPDDTKDLVFYEFEDNTRTYLNLVERSCTFKFFFVSQYDPNQGTITQVDIEVTS